MGTPIVGLKIHVDVDKRSIGYISDACLSVLLKGI